MKGIGKERKRHIDWKKAMMIAGMALLLAAISVMVEVFLFNGQPLFHPSKSIRFKLSESDHADGITMYNGISRDVQKEIAEDTRRYRLDELDDMEDILNARENYRAVCFELERPAYYKKLKIHFKTARNITYYLDINYVNEYGQKETYYVSDRAFRMLKYGVTNINKTVSSVTVYIPPKARTQIKSVEFTDEVKCNKYRMVCTFTFLVVLFTLLFGSKLFVGRLELLVFCWGSLFGLCFLMSQGVNENSWDEHIHFMAVYQLASGSSYRNTQTIRMMEQRIQKEFYSTNEEKYAVTNYMNDQYQKDEKAEVCASRKANYKDLLYLPQILMAKLAITYRWSFERLCMWTKGVSLVIYILGLAWIVYKARAYKLLFTIVGLMPLHVFVAASFSYNSLTLIFHMAGFMLWLNSMYGEERTVGIKQIFPIAVCFFLGSCSKPMYILMGLLILLIPTEKYKNPALKKWLWGLVIAAVAAVFAVLGIPIIKTLMEGGTIAGDSRGGNTDVAAQLSFVLAYPVSYLKIMMRDILGTAVEYLLNTESYLKFGRFPAMDGNFPIYIAILILGVTFVSHTEEDRKFCLQKKEKMSLFLLCILLVAVIWTCMYLVFTPQGRTGLITGVQGRYYAPILVPFMVCCRTDKILWKVKEVTYNKVFLGILAMLSLYVIYFTMMEPYCF